MFLLLETEWLSVFHIQCYPLINYKTLNVDCPVVPHILVSFLKYEDTNLYLFEGKLHKEQLGAENKIIFKNQNKLKIKIVPNK